MVEDGPFTLGVELFGRVIGLAGLHLFGLTLTTPIYRVLYKKLRHVLISTLIVSGFSGIAGWLMKMAGR